MEYGKKEFDNLTEKQTGSEEIFDGVILHVFKDTVELPNGDKATRELVRHVGAAAVVAITDDEKVIVERQFRYPFGEVMTEIPAGKLDSKLENPLEAAKRELLEETGITADEWRELGVFYPTVAYTDEKIWIYMAKGLHYGKQSLDEDEFLNVEAVPIDELLQDIMDGKIKDGKTQVAVLKAARLMG